MTTPSREEALEDLGKLWPLSKGYDPDIFERLRTFITNAPAPQPDTGEGEAFPEDALPRFGWAPGNYLNRPCRDCHSPADGAKGCWRCYDCAVKAYKSTGRLPTPPVQQSEEGLPKRFNPNHGHAHCFDYDEPGYIIVFADQDVAPIPFIGEGAREAALKTWERKNTAWSCSLYETMRTVPTSLPVQSVGVETVPAGWQRRLKYAENGRVHEWSHCTTLEATDAFERNPQYEYRRIFAEAPVPVQGVCPSENANNEGQSDLSLNGDTQCLGVDSGSETVSAASVPSAGGEVERYRLSLLESANDAIADHEDDIAEAFNSDSGERPDLSGPECEVNALMLKAVCEALDHFARKSMFCETPQADQRAGDEPKPHSDSSEVGSSLTRAEKDDCVSLVANSHAANCPWLISAAKDCCCGSLLLSHKLSDFFASLSPTKGEVTEAIYADRKYLAGLRAGWNMGVVNDHDKFKNTEEQLLAEIVDARAALAVKEG